MQEEADIAAEILAIITKLMSGIAAEKSPVAVHE